MAHHLDAERRTLVGNGRAHDQLDARIFEDLLLARCLLRFGELLREFRRQVWLFGVERDKFAATALDGLDLTVDVIVIDADGREADPGGLGRR